MYMHLVSSPHSFLHICACSPPILRRTKWVFLSSPQPWSPRPTGGSSHVPSIIKPFSTKRVVHVIGRRLIDRFMEVSSKKGEQKKKHSTRCNYHQSRRRPPQGGPGRRDGVLTVTGDPPSASSGKAEDEKSPRPRWGGALKHNARPLTLITPLRSS